MVPGPASAAVGFRRAAIYLLEDRPGSAPVRAGAGFGPAQDSVLDGVAVSLVATVGLATAEAELARLAAALARLSP